MLKCRAVDILHTAAALTRRTIMPEVEPATILEGVQEASMRKLQRAMRQIPGRNFRRRQVDHDAADDGQRPANPTRRRSGRGAAESSRPWASTAKRSIVPPCADQPTRQALLPAADRIAAMRVRTPSFPRRPIGRYFAYHESTVRHCPGPIAGRVCRTPPDPARRARWRHRNRGQRTRSARITPRVRTCTSC